MQSGLACKTDENVVLASAECLDDLTELWHSTVRSLQVGGISPTLEIVYRTQQNGVAFGEAHDLARAIEASRQEFEDDPDLQRALAESLLDIVPTKDSEAELTDDKNPVADTGPPSQRVIEQLSDKPHIPWYSRNAATESKQSEAMERDQPVGEWGTADLGTRASKRKEPQPETPRIIGRKSFAFDEAALHAYVQDVLQWWRGERPPRGVDLDHTRRCS